MIILNPKAREIKVTVVTTLEALESKGWEMREFYEHHVDNGDYEELEDARKHVDENYTTCLQIRTNQEVEVFYYIKKDNDGGVESDTMPSGDNEESIKDICEMIGEKSAFVQHIQGNIIDESVDKDGNYVSTFVTIG